MKATGHGPHTKAPGGLRLVTKVASILWGIGMGIAGGLSTITIGIATTTGTVTGTGITIATTMTTTIGIRVKNR